MKCLKRKPEAINMFVVARNVGSIGGGACMSGVNLYNSLKGLGFRVRVLRVGERREKKVRVLSKGRYPYQNITLEDAMMLLKNPKQLSVIIHIIHHKNLRNIATELIEAGCACYLRGSAEVRPELIKAWKNSGSRIIALRKRIRVMLEEKYGLDSICVPHVYLPQRPKKKRREYNAISITRVASCKRIEMLIEANRRLPKRKRIHIYGLESRQYAHFTLDEKMPGWREQYHGEFPIGTGARIAASGHYAIDLTEFKMDGGGTQNTFFEAWEAGCVLILNKAWYWKHGIVRPNKHAIYVGSVEELVRVLRKPADPDHFAPHVKKLMARRTPEKIIPRLIRAIGGRA